MKLVKTEIFFTMVAKSFVQTFNGVANLQMSFHYIIVYQSQGDICSILVNVGHNSTICFSAKVLLRNKSQISTFPQLTSKIVGEVFVCNAFRKLWDHKKVSLRLFEER